MFFSPLFSDRAETCSCGSIQENHHALPYCYIQCKEGAASVLNIPRYSLKQNWSRMCLLRWVVHGFWKRSSICCPKARFPSLHLLGNNDVPQIGSDLCVSACVPNTNSWEMAFSGKFYRWPEALDHSALVLSSQSAPELGSNWGWTPKFSLHLVWGTGIQGGSAALQHWVCQGQCPMARLGPVGSAWITLSGDDECATAASEKKCAALTAGCFGLQNDL